MSDLDRLKEALQEYSKHLRATQAIERYISVHDPEAPIRVTDALPLPRRRKVTLSQNFTWDNKASVWKNHAKGILVAQSEIFLTVLKAIRAQPTRKCSIEAIYASVKHRYNINYLDCVPIARIWKARRLDQLNFGNEELWRLGHEYSNSLDYEEHSIPSRSSLEEQEPNDNSILGGILAGLTRSSSPVPEDASSDDYILSQPSDWVITEEDSISDVEISELSENPFVIETEHGSSDIEIKALVDSLFAFETEDSVSGIETTLLAESPFIMDTEGKQKSDDISSQGIENPIRYTITTSSAPKRRQRGIFTSSAPKRHQRGISAHRSTKQTPQNPNARPGEPSRERNSMTPTAEIRGLKRVEGEVNWEAGRTIPCGEFDRYREEADSNFRRAGEFLCIEEARKARSEREARSERAASDHSNSAEDSREDDSDNLQAKTSSPSPYRTQPIGRVGSMMDPEYRRRRAMEEAHRAQVASQLGMGM